MKENNTEQDRFYTSISEFYNDLFPFNPDQLNFVKENTCGLMGKDILDLGCGTGELSLRLAQDGARVTGIDLNESFINQAKERNNHLNAEYEIADMLEIRHHFPEKRFDTVICFGNTLVHLANSGEVRKLVYEVNQVLQEGGIFLIQILNYDYILDARINALPVIENSKVKFIRNYLYPEDSGFIRFSTTLIIKEEQKSIINETSLLPLKSNELRQILAENGFGSINFYSDFRMNLFSGSHLPMVVSCRKN